jgi:hypothetical protein
MLTFPNLLKLIPFQHLAHKLALLFAEMRQVIEAREVRLEGGGDGGVHVAEEEDDVVSEYAGGSLQPYLFHLEGVLVQISQVAHTVLQELLSLFQLAPHKHESSVVEAEPDEIDALVG